jgi:hypothetical protein
MLKEGEWIRSYHLAIGEGPFYPRIMSWVFEEEAVDVVHGDLKAHVSVQLFLALQVQDKRWLDGLVGLVNKPRMLSDDYSM